MGNKQKNQPLMIQCRSTCHLQTKSPAPSDGWGWGCTDMERQGPPALGAAGLSHLSPHPREGGKYSYDPVTDEEVGSGRSRLTEWGNWGEALGLQVPSVCLAPRQYCLGQCLHDSSLPRPITVPGNRLQPPDLLIR